MGPSGNIPCGSVPDGRSHRFGRKGNRKGVSDVRISSGVAGVAGVSLCGVLGVREVRGVHGGLAQGSRAGQGERAERHRILLRYCLREKDC